MTDPKPSNGSLIRTFADCSYRIEDILTPDDGIYYGKGFCRLGARNTDYSHCGHPDCPPGKDGEGFQLYYCEVACRDGKCPAGFMR
jgi:hypothetical protein